MPQIVKFCGWSLPKLLERKGFNVGTNTSPNNSPDPPSLSLVLSEYCVACVYTLKCKATLETSSAGGGRNRAACVFSWLPSTFSTTVLVWCVMGFWWNIFGASRLLLYKLKRPNALSPTVPLEQQMSDKKNSLRLMRSFSGTHLKASKIRPTMFDWFHSCPRPFTTWVTHCSLASSVGSPMLPGAGGMLTARACEAWDWAMEPMKSDLNVPIIV
mmetsp:Transcript_53409/g.148519  ORF Transcript_53409/g.148519 Transcript_53409/m.148519 type:complete len:214 (+) Transcript_53409:1395-2036(+)